MELVILMEELGYALAPLPFLSTVSAGLALQEAGSDEQRERWLPGIASGELRATAGLETDGEARLVPDAEGAELIVLLSRDGGRVVEAAAGRGGAARDDRRHTALRARARRGRRGAARRHAARRSTGS